MRENGFREGISCEQRRRDSLLLRITIALHDHEFSPRFRVLRLLTAPSEMRLGNICRYVSTLTLLELLISLMEQILLGGICLALRHQHATVKVSESYPPKDLALDPMTPPIYSTRTIVETRFPRHIIFGRPST
jgi:hypothetical protein